MSRINEVEIKKQSWMQVIVNKEDGYINGTKLANQVGMSLYQFLNLEDTKESIEHIKMLIGCKEKYEGDSPWDNVKGMYVHPFLALEMVAIKKCDSDYEEYYEFLKTTIIEFLENNQELKEQYNFMVDMFDIHVNIDTSDILSSEEFHG